MTYLEQHQPALIAEILDLADLVTCCCVCPNPTYERLPMWGCGQCGRCHRPFRQEMTP